MSSDAEKEEELKTKKRTPVRFDSSSSSSSSSEDEEEEEPAPKRRLVIAGESDGEGAQQGTLTSSPIKSVAPPLKQPVSELTPTARAAKLQSFVHRTKDMAVHHSQTHAISTLKDCNDKLQKKLARAESQLALEVAKKRENENFAKEVVALKEKLRESDDKKNKIQEEKVKVERLLKEAEEKIERERKEREAEKEELLIAISKLNKANNDLRIRSQEKEMKMKAMEEEKEKRAHAILHLECCEGRLGERFIEQLDGEASFMCFSNPSTKKRCHHITLKGNDISVKVRNMKWPADRHSK